MIKDSSEDQLPTNLQIGKDQHTSVLTEVAEQIFSMK